MERRIGLPPRARSSASAPHGYQSTGFAACCRRYGEVSRLSLFTLGVHFTGRVNGKIFV